MIEELFYVEPSLESGTITRTIGWYFLAIWRFLWQTDRALAGKLVLSWELELSWCRTREQITATSQSQSSHSQATLRIEITHFSGQNNSQVELLVLFTNILSPHRAAMGPATSVETTLSDDVIWKQSWCWWCVLFWALLMGRASVIG